MSKKEIEIMNNIAPAVPATIGMRNYIITVNNRSYNVSVTSADGVQNSPVTVSEVGSIKAASASAPAPAPAASPESEGTEVEAPTPGTIIKILVDVGASVVMDQSLVVMETMKMESEVKSPCNGKILAIHIATGDIVQAADPLFTIGR
ncbi:MAG: acetyl-CoA carboxylase biotin carboxyl carrier protein subunit [Pseudomonadota bacterium]